MRRKSLSPSALKRAAQALRAGDLVILPTETVYGLGALASLKEAVQKIYKAKKRPASNPLILHVASKTEALKYGVFSSFAHALADAFWPGPLTLVLPEKKDPSKTCALRVPAHPGFLSLLKDLGEPVAAPSANLSGRTTVTCPDHIAPSIMSHVALLVDDGPCSLGLESTIVGLHRDTPVLLRQGSLPEHTLEACLGTPLSSPHTTSSVASPGLHFKHYAPQTPLRLQALAPRPGEAFLGFGASSHPATLNLSPRGDMNEAAFHLFSMLHVLDVPAYKGIAVAPIPHAGLGKAINDRLQRAASSQR